MNASTVHPVDERLPAGRLAALGLQHVLVMYAGAVAVPLIVGRALKLTPEQVALLISADLFCCGIVTLIQSLGVTQWFGIKLPVMMGVTFAAGRPDGGDGQRHPGADGARAIFGAIIGAGIVSILIAPHGQPACCASFRRWSPAPSSPVIGISLMRVGIGWAIGGPAVLAQRPTCPSSSRWSTGQAAAAAASAPRRRVARRRSSLPGRSRWSTTRTTRALDNMAIAAFVLVSILLIVKYAQGLRRQHLGAAGHRHRLRGGRGDGHDELRQGRPRRTGSTSSLPFAVRHADVRPGADPDDDAGDDRGDDRIDRHVPGAARHHRQARSASPTWRAGLRTDGLGTLIGGIFNTFPYTSFSQNVGLVGVTGVKSRFVCVAGGVIMIVLGPAAEDGGAGRVDAARSCSAAPGW